MRNKNTYLAVALLMIIVGCANSSSDNLDPNKPDNSSEFSIEDLDYTPSSRWPEKGSFSYNFDYTYNGSRCIVNKSFANKANYCIGLQDQLLNSSCALLLRKDAYEDHCGNDFQELNFQNDFWKSGFDNRLQRHCQTASPKKSTFKTIKHFCQFLKDESLHASCFWNDRFEKFKQLNCHEAFSNEPQVTVPQLPPPGNPPGTDNPEDPTPPNQPADPLDQIPVVKYLRTNGVTISVNWQAINQQASYPMPGSLPINEQLKIFWKELENNKNEILLRKNVIDSIEITIYTNYRQYADEKKLYLDFETKQNSLKEYFPLFDKILKYAADLDIDFNIIHSGTRLDLIPYLPLREIISVIEKKWSTLISMRGTFEEITTDSFSSYFSGSKNLILKRDKIEDEFQRYIQLLKPISSVYAWAKKQNVAIECTFDIDDNSAQVYSAFAVIQNSISDLDQLSKAKMLKKLSIYLIDSSSQHYWSALGDISISIGSANKSLVSKILANLGKQAKMSIDIQRPIELSSSEIRDEYFASISMLEKLWPKIKSKSSKINKITLGYESKYYDSLKELVIGSDSSLKDTEVIVSSIK